MNQLVKIEKPLVSVSWLFQNKEATNLIILNGTLPKVSTKKSKQENEEYQIPKTRFFDIKKEFSKQEAPFPNTVLEPEIFQQKAQKLGINKESCIVVYDEHGIYSSARVWWLFKTMGFDNISVLNGGFPEWKKNKLPTERKQDFRIKSGDLLVKYNPELLVKSDVILKHLNDSSTQILDARSTGRFNSTLPEPRTKVRGGHIPNSLNIPYTSIILNGKLKENTKLKEIFNAVNPEEKQMIFSCGSGITACVLALAATTLGYENLAVYDGSWTEWGSLTHLPIEK